MAGVNPMIQFKQGIAKLLLILTLILPWANVQALDTFESGGMITDKGYSDFTVNNQKYRISPSAKLQSYDPGRTKFSDFKAGDLVLFKGTILSGVHYVDLIVYHPPFDS
jgi:hypothetical protein